jgi:pSer/pThr/pTyr-binding forkhead associated (FHA) protein
MSDAPRGLPPAAPGQPEEERSTQPVYETTGLLRKPAAAASSAAVAPAAAPPLKWVPPASLVPSDVFEQMKARLPPFVLVAVKDGKPVEVSEGRQRLPLAAQPAFLFGRDALVCDVVLPNPSCSAQHLAVFHRYCRDAPPRSADPFDVDVCAVDLAASNGTWLNGDRMAAGRAYDLLAGDVIRCATSSKSFVVTDSR